MLKQIGALKMRVEFRPVCAGCGTEDAPGDRWYKREDGALVCWECAPGGLVRINDSRGHCERAATEALRTSCPCCGAKPDAGGRWWRTIETRREGMYGVPDT